MDGMDDMNAPMPPMDTETPPEDPNMMPPEPGGAPDDMGDMGGGEEPDPMAGDPNALSAGGNEGPDANMGGDDIQSKYNSLSPDQQKAADKYIESMMNNESRFNFKRIIDETFSTIMGDGKKNPMDGLTRPEKRTAKEAVTKDINPYMPRK